MPHYQGRNKCDTDNILTKGQLVKLLHKMFVYSEEEVKDKNEADISRKPNTFLCQVCKVDMTNLEKMYEHLQASAKCCNAYTEKAQHLLGHDPPQLHSFGKEKYFEVFGCYMCDYQAYTPQDVRTHWIITHTNEALYLCK